MSLTEREKGNGALKANSAQTERLHHFSHALRNRLTGLFEAMRHLREEPADQPQEIAQFAERQFFQALREVEELLDDMQVDRGPGEIKREPVNMQHLLRMAEDHVRPRLEKKKQVLLVTAHDPLNVLGDAHYLQQMLDALLSNASKFSPGTSRIEVEGAARDGRVLITVRDHGVGLSPEDLPRIFDRFAWLGSLSTDGEAQGRSTLSRVRQWVMAQDGEISATSAGSGQGTTFQVRLPQAP